MPTLDSVRDLDASTRAALRRLLEANDAFRVAYHEWLRSARPEEGPVALQLREAQDQVGRARLLVETAHDDEPHDDKAWSGH